MVPRRFPAAVLALFAAGLLASQQSARAQDAAKGTADAAKGSALLAEARKAIGGDDKLAAIKRLQISGTFLRSTGPDQVIDGDFDVLIELPDKYRRNEITGFAGANAERTEALNGTEVWDDSSGGLTQGRGFGGGGGFPRNGRGGGGDRGGGGGFRGGGGDRGRNPNQNGGAGQADAASSDERGKELLRRTRQAELARLALVWLLTTDGQVAWIGTAQAPEGTADVLEVRPANAVPTRLFLDPATHLPLMITWSGQAGRGGDVRRRGAAAPAAPPQGQATLELHMGDYKTVNGIKLPHLITRGPEGITQEELKIKSFKINPNFKADTFVQ
jgi:hypothetical protein